MSAPAMDDAAPAFPVIEKAQQRASRIDEMAVLGAMMLAAPNSTVPAEIRALLEPGEGQDGVGEHHFMLPAHKLVWRTIITLMNRGDPHDLNAVWAEIPVDKLRLVGNGAYLADLTSACPTPANGTWYARNVANTTLLRAMGDAAAATAQAAAGVSLNDATEALEVAQARLNMLTPPGRRGAMVAWPVMGPEALDEMERLAALAQSEDPDAESVFSTPWPDLNRLLGPVQPGAMIIIAGRPGMAKALALDTPLPTPTGWTTMGDVQIGEELLDAQGRPTVVTNATEIMLNRPCYEVAFSDGSTIVADAQHQWAVSTRAARRHKVVQTKVLNTEQMVGSVRIGAEQRLNYAVQVAAALQLPEADLPIAPYTLGVWLGDGHSRAARITSADPEIPMYLQGDGYEVRANPSNPLLYGFSLRDATPPAKSRNCGNCGVLLGSGRVARRCTSCRAAVPSIPKLLQKMGVWGNKHIPNIYLRASDAQRRALLAGLLDTDGTVLPHGSIKFTVTSRRLAYDVRELVLSLGYRCTIATQPVKGRTADSSVAYAVNFSTADEVFRLERKRLAHKERAKTKDRKRNGVRYITAIRPVPSVPVRCVKVDNPEHLYLAGDAMIPTHNSTAMRDIAQHLGMRRKRLAPIFSLEMSRMEIGLALMAAGAKIRTDDIKHGTMSDDDWVKAARYVGMTADAKLTVDDTPGMNLAYVDRSLGDLARQYEQDPAAYFFDYLQLGHERGHGTRQEEVSAMSRGHKLLAKRRNTVAVVLSQLNRGPEGRADKRPQLSDLRESGSLEQDADIVILLHRDDYYDPECPNPGEIDLIVAKNRGGPTGVVTLAAQLHMSRLVSMAMD